MILIVEDEQASRRALQQLLGLCGYDAQAFGSAEDALKDIQTGHVPEMALVDVDLPGMNGPEFASRLHRVYPGVQCVFMSGNDREYLARLRPSRNDPFLRKPLDVSDLLQIVDRASHSQNVGPKQHSH